MNQRDNWSTKIGLILAMAGNAIGLGNFLRFPVQATLNGGGAFMIPYFVSLILLAVPIMWMEWAMGRLGGSYNRGSMPAIFEIAWRSRFARFIGALGIIIPVGIVFYYVYIESWTIAYAFFSLTKKYFSITTSADMKRFISDFQGVNTSLGVSITAYLFFLITFILNFIVLYGGISKGIEKFAKIAMPCLFIFAVILLIKVITLGTPDPSKPENNVLNGFGFLWNPDYTKLTDAKIWLAAAGQVFFTASIASGAIHTYASYVKKNDDIALSGFATLTLNEFAEIVLGSSIAIPVAYAFFGHYETVEIAKSGSFNLGFVAMPLIFQKMGAFFGFIWFLLLFFAGITSSLALTQPLITFLKDEMGYSHKKAVFFSAGLIFLVANFIILGFRYGSVDEFDFWFGTAGLALFAFIETVVFMWFFGEDKVYSEITQGAKMYVPRIFMLILKYVTPVFLLLIFIAWICQNAGDVILLKSVNSTSELYWRWASRVVIVMFFCLILYLVAKAKPKNMEII